MKQLLSVPAIGAQMRRTYRCQRLHIATLSILGSMMVHCTSDPESSEQRNNIPGTSHESAGDGSADGTSADHTGVGAAGFPGAADAASPMLKPDDRSPTWSGIYNYDLHSCKNRICHGSTVAGIDMTSAAAAYDSLVDVSANPQRECASLGLKRVVPGDPESSLLYLKLDSSPPCGQQMPVGGLVRPEVAKRIHDWIAMGAKND